MSQNEILKVEGLRTSFFTHLGEVKAIRGISFSLNKGQTIGIVGESGSGKSVTSLSIMNLLTFPGKIVEGSITFNGEELTTKSKKEMLKLRGNDISMIFQDPMTSLNPVYTIGEQLRDVIKHHQKISTKKANEKILNLFELVGIPDPLSRIDNYPHEFSGGMRQRAMIAMALSCGPELLIADEPTTALDVTIQAQILELMTDISKESGTSIILITHDLGVVANTCERIIVMYGGLIMEEGTAEEIFLNPLHPYTKGLLKSIPNPKKKERLIPILGTPPDLLKPPVGCPFVARCDNALNICARKEPPFYYAEEGHRAMCWLMHEKAQGGCK